MVKINLLRNHTAPEVKEVTEVAEAVVETPVVEKEKKKKELKDPRDSRGVSKSMILITFAVLTTVAAYFIWDYGMLGMFNKSPATNDIMIADEVSMDDPQEESPAVDNSADKPAAVKEKPAVVKPTAVKQKQNTVAKPKTNKVVTSKPVNSSLTRNRLADARNHLAVFGGIVNSIHEGVGKLQMSVADTKVSIALGINSRDDAAKFLSNIRSNWQYSNLRASQFERAGDGSPFAYRSQFEGTIKGVAANPAVRYSVVNINGYKKSISDEVERAGLKLMTIKSETPRNHSGLSVTPLYITMEGSNAAISNFIKAIASGNNAYEISRVSILYSKGGISNLSLGLLLLNSGNAGTS